MKILRMRRWCEMRVAGSGTSVTTSEHLVDHVYILVILRRCIWRKMRATGSGTSVIASEHFVDHVYHRCYLIDNKKSWQQPRTYEVISLQKLW